MLTLTQLSLQNSDSGRSDVSHKSNETVIKYNCHSDATDLGFPVAPWKESPKVPAPVTRIWDRPNGIRSEYPQLGNGVYLDNAGTTVRDFYKFDLAPLVLLTGETGHSLTQKRS